MSASPAPVDAAARERALDPRRSFIVQAPAGSGKTGLLIQRYLALLATVNAPEEIVAITFTRKAAGEMRARIQEALAAARGEPPAAGHGRRTHELARAALERSLRRGWAIELQPARLRIQTIDALCTGLARQMPWLSRFGGEPRLTDDPIPLYQQAVRETLAQLDQDGPWGESIATVLAHLDNDMQRLARMLVEMLAHRDQWLRHVGGGFAEPTRRRAHLETALAHALRDELAALREAVPPPLAPEIVALAAYAGANLRDRGADSPVCACAELTTLPDAQPAAYPLWRGLAAFLLRKDGAWRTARTVRDGFPSGSDPLGSAMKDRARRLQAALCAHEELRRRLLRVPALPAPGYDDEQWRVLLAVSQLLQLAAAALRVTFSVHGQVDFVEVAQAAVEALGEEQDPTDLALVLDYRIQHILVDEFQDTSHTQFRLLTRLVAGWTPGDGRTLFVVGDPMQSIYRFREADVGLYLQAWEEGLGDVPLERLRLGVNFRSRAALVEWCNGVFARVFPQTGDITTGAVPWTRAEAFRDPPPGAGAHEAVSVHPQVGADYAQEAEAVAAIVAAAGSPPAESAGTAILVRSRKHLAAILPRLREAGVPCRGVEIEPLAARPVVQDLLALTRALLHLGDRVAWLAVLRAPWCGLRLADLYVLGGSDPRAPVYDQLHDAGLSGRLDEGARERVARVRAVLTAAMAEWGRVPLRRAVEGTWCALGGPACCTGRDLDDAAAFLDCLEGLADDEPDSTRLHAALGRLFAAPDSGRGAVEVMTIHKAKGLEFDTVILPGLGRTSGREAQRLLAWSERAVEPGGVELLIAPLAAVGSASDRTWRYLQVLEREREVHERARLVYVAATRARERLHLLGHATRRAAGAAPRAENGSLLACLWDAVHEEYDGECIAEAPAPTYAPGDATERREGPSGADVAVRRLPAGWRPPPPPPPLLAAGDAPNAGPGVEFAWAGPGARHVGSVVHRMLARIARDGPAAWPASRLAAQRSAWRAMLTGLGVPRAELEDALLRTEDALANTLADARGAWLLDPGYADARAEYALTGVIQGRTVSVIIDRTFIDAGGVRWVVDYKTGSHEGTQREAFLERERERYRPQLERYGTLAAGLGGEPVRLGLYFPLLQGWREWPYR